MSSTNRICIYGGPGVGKSKMAMDVCSFLKEIHMPVEFVDEAIKGMAWRKIEPTGFDSVWLFGKQIHREDIVLRSGGAVVTGGPLLQQVVYMRDRSERFSDDFFHISQLFEEKYPALNILVNRNVPFQPEGRYQTSKEEASIFDNATRDILVQAGFKFYQFVPQEFDQVIQCISDYLKICPSTKERDHD